MITMMEDLVSVDKLKNLTLELDLDDYVRHALQDQLTKPPSYFQIQALLDLTWEKLNTGHWSKVPLKWRKLFSILTLLKVRAVLDLQKSPSQDILKDLVKMCDVGLLMGAPILDNACSKLASRFSSRLSSEIRELEDKEGNNNLDNSKKRFKRDSVPNVKAVDVKECLDLQTFITDYKSTQTPVLIKHAIDDWPAISTDSSNRWTVSYFRRVMGFRTVPVELGKRYTDSSWTQTLITVNEFIDNYLNKKSNSATTTMGYLAQHELFEQIPELKADFETPLYCYTNDNVDNADIDVNIWFGPGGTVSPLHTDPKDNCLCQVMGRKYVRLYKSDQTPFLNPYDSEAMLSNTSRIDLEQDYDDIVKNHPDFANAQGLECFMDPGDILYIPPKCWHFVKSLSTSCSLSFWF